MPENQYPVMFALPVDLRGPYEPLRCASLVSHVNKHWTVGILFAVRKADGFCPSTGHNLPLQSLLLGALVHYPRWPANRLKKVC